MVARVSGMAYQEYVQRRILEPLGMEHSAFAPDERQHPDISTACHEEMKGQSVVLMP